MHSNNSDAQSSNRLTNQTKAIAITAAVVILVAISAGLYIKNQIKDSSSDRDNDGIADNIDRCPDEVGTIEFSGCAYQNASLNESSQSLSTLDKEKNFAEQNKNAKQDGKSRTNEVPSNQQSSSSKLSEVKTGPTQQADNQITITETSATETSIKNVAAKLKSNSGANKISWNAELAKVKDLLLTITTANGLNFKKDVTGLSSYTFNPGSGEWQGKKCTVTLSSSDPKITIDNSKLPNTFFNCSAE
jgi:hypothetical protein